MPMLGLTRVMHYTEDQKKLIKQMSRLKQLFLVLDELLGIKAPGVNSFLDQAFFA